MPEVLHEGVTTTQLLRSCDIQRLPNGNTLFVSQTFLEPGLTLLGPKDDTVPLTMIVSSAGEALLREPGFVGLLTLDKPADDLRSERGLFGLVTHETRGNWPRKQQVAVKRVWDHPAGSLTGVEQFQATEDLRGVGVDCAVPLVATHWRHVSRWLDGRTPSFDRKESSNFSEHIQRLKNIAEQFKEEGKWHKEWDLDARRENYIVRGAKFIALDPVAPFPY